MQLLPVARWPSTSRTAPQLGRGRAVGPPSLTTDLTEDLRRARSQARVRARSALDPEELEPREPLRLRAASGTTQRPTAAAAAAAARAGARSRRVRRSGVGASGSRQGWWPRVLVVGARPTLLEAGDAVQVVVLLLLAVGATLERLGDEWAECERTLALSVGLISMASSIRTGVVLYHHAQQQNAHVRHVTLLRDTQSSSCLSEQGLPLVERRRRAREQQRPTRPQRRLRVRRGRGRVRRAALGAQRGHRRR